MVLRFSPSFPSRFTINKTMKTAPNTPASGDLSKPARPGLAERWCKPHASDKNFYQLEPQLWASPPDSSKATYTTSLQRSSKMWTTNQTYPTSSRPMTSIPIFLGQIPMSVEEQLQRRHTSPLLLTKDMNVKFKGNYLLSTQEAIYFSITIKRDKCLSLVPIDIPKLMLASRAPSVLQIPVKIKELKRGVLEMGAGIWLNGLLHIY